MMYTESYIGQILKMTNRHLASANSYKLKALLIKVKALPYNFQFEILYRQE